MRRVSLSIMCFLLIPLSVLSQRDDKDSNTKRISNGVSISYMYLPLTYAYSEADLHDCKGIGVNYELSVPLFQSRVHFMTGLGFSHFLCEMDYDETKTFIPSENNLNLRPSITSGETETDTYIYKQHAIEYMYLSAPVNIGFRALDRNGYTVIPYLGVLMKYNLSYVEKYSHESFSYGDVYYNVFKDHFEENDAERFMLQYNFGLKLGYNHLYANIAYVKDFSQLYDVVRFSPDEFKLVGYHGPETMHFWQFGIGFRF